MYTVKMDQPFLCLWPDRFQFKENDELYVFKSGSGILVGGCYSYSYFTGWLVEEDLKF